MIELVIFHLHIVAALYAFTKSWLRNKLKDGILAILLIGMIFSIGWTLTSPIARLLMPAKFNSIWFNQDTLSLILLSFPESLFYYIFFLKGK